VVHPPAGLRTVKKGDELQPPTILYWHDTLSLFVQLGCLMEPLSRNIAPSRTRFSCSYRCRHFLPLYDKTRPYIILWE